jgi:hypothetical protein
MQEVLLTNLLLFYSNIAKDFKIRHTN